MYEKIVYVVDDDLAVRDALKRSLTKRNYRVETFASAEAFLDTPRSDDRHVWCWTYECLE